MLVNISKEGKVCGRDQLAVFMHDSKLCLKLFNFKNKTSSFGALHEIKYNYDQFAGDFYCYSNLCSLQKLKPNQA